MAKKEINVKCPSCKNTFSYYASEFRPFCTERCKMIDLGLWVTESYTVASNQPLSESDIETVLREQEKEFYGEDH